ETPASVRAGSGRHYPVPIALKGSLYFVCISIPNFYTTGSSNDLLAVGAKCGSSDGILVPFESEKKIARCSIPYFCRVVVTSCNYALTIRSERSGLHSVVLAFE